MNTLIEALVQLLAPFLAAFGGIPITRYWTGKLHDRFGDHKQRVPELTKLVGILERFLIAVFVLWLPVATGPFVVGWMAVKAAGGWGTLFKPGLEGDDAIAARKIYVVGLLGSLASVIIAVSVGLFAVWLTDLNL